MLSDKTFICFDSKENSLKRISSHKLSKRGWNISGHVIYKINLDQIIDQALRIDQIEIQINEEITVVK